MPIQCVLGAGTFHLWRVFGQQASAMMLVHRSEPCFTNHISAWERTLVRRLTLRMRE
jgi:hypothetical protein